MSEELQKLTHRIAYKRLGEDQTEDFLNKMRLIQEYADKEVERYKQENTFDEWCRKYVKPQGENVYLYNKTAYSLHELILIFKQIKPTNDE